MSNDVTIHSVEKIYDVEYDCPKCGELTQDKLIGCMKAKCTNCEHITEFDDSQLEWF